VPERAVRFAFTLTSAAPAYEAPEFAEQRTRAAAGFDNRSAGAFRVGPIPPGRYTALVSGAGYVPASFEIELDGVRETKHDVVLAALRRLPVRLHTPEGAPLARAIVNAPGFRPPFPIDIVATDEPLALATTVQGRAATPKVTGRDAESSGAPAARDFASKLHLDLSRVGEGTDFIGTFECSADARCANVLWRSQVVAHLTLTPATDELVIALDPQHLFDALCSVQLVALDERSRVAIANARVFVNAEEQTRYAEVKTAADGSARLNGLARGRTLVTIEADGYAKWRRLFELPPGRVAELGQVLLAPAVELRVRVVDASGMTVAHTLEFIEIGPDGFESAPQTVVTNGKDSALVRGLATRRHVVRSQLAALGKRDPSGDGADASTHGELADGMLAIAPTTVDLAVPVAGELVYTLEPLRAWTLELGFAGKPSVRTNITTHEHMRVAESVDAGDARVTFLLTPGHYVVTVLDAGTQLAERAFTFDGSVTTLKLP
jgi:hypothetical protein